MTVLFYDVYEDALVKEKLKTALAHGITDLLYADDTLLVTKDTETMNALLKAIETESWYYNMKLNMGKCLTLTMNGISHTQFQDGTTLVNVKDAKYLGVSLHEGASNKPDLNSRFSATLATITTLKKFWTSSAKPKWKLLVFNAVAGAKILYGLESLQLTEADYRRLDAFQQRGLRRCLGIPPTFIDRTATNKTVLLAAEQASERKGEKQNSKRSRRLSKEGL